MRLFSLLGVEHERLTGSSRWRYTIRQTKSGDYNVQVRSPLPSASDSGFLIRWLANIDLFDKVFYSACPARCEGQDLNVAADPRKPVALSHVTNIPGLMRVVDTE